MARKTITQHKGKKKGATRATPESVTITYDLYELPTAQHKAGLAGLLLQIDSMNERKAAGALPTDVEIPEVISRDATAATVRFTQAATQALFDDLYDAEVIEQVRKKKQRNREPRKVVEVEVKQSGTRTVKKEKRFVYDAVQPIGPFLLRFLAEGKECWHKLWQDMLFTIPRNQDATLGPFKDMAQLRLARAGPSEWSRMQVTRRKSDKSCYLRCREGLTCWGDLLRLQANRRAGRLATTSLSGALLLGVQDKNAELLASQDRIDHAVLLHFWPLTARVFVPEVIDRDGKSQFVGYVLAVPEVRDLVAFCIAYVRLLQELNPRLRGYRPADAVISLPAQGSLEFMHQLGELAERRIIQERPARYLAAIEFLQVVKAGNNVKMTAHGRVPPTDGLLQAYTGIRNAYRNPMVQSAMVLAALGDRPWFLRFDELLVEREWSFFVHSIQEKHRTPRSMIAFAWEINSRFQQIKRNYEIRKEAHMSTNNDADEVDRLVYQLVGKYVRIRACAKAGATTKPDDIEWWKREGWKTTAEERRDVCSKLFLELRSRQGDDFVRHFTATLGSVPQWLDGDQYLAVTRALMRTHAAETAGEDRPRTRDDVKTLTLLALSAHSRSLTSKKDDEAGRAKENKP